MFYAIQEGEEEAKIEREREKKQYLLDTNEVSRKQMFDEKILMINCNRKSMACMMEDFDG